MKLPTTEQVRRTVRTALAVLVAVAMLVPLIVQVTGLTVAEAPWLGTIVAVAAAVTRLMADPKVNELLRRFLGEPFAAAPGALEQGRVVPGVVVPDPTREDRVE